MASSCLACGRPSRLCPLSTACFVTGTSHVVSSPPRSACLRRRLPLCAVVNAEANDGVSGRAAAVDPDEEGHTLRRVREDAAGPKRHRFAVRAASRALTARTSDEGDGTMSITEMDLSLRQWSISEPG